MMKTTLIRALLAGCSALASHAALAQSEAAAPTSSASADPAPPVNADPVNADPTSETAASTPPDTVADGEIVVTARRRSESLQDTPISVSAISGEQLTKAGVSDIQGLQ